MCNTNSEAPSADSQETPTTKKWQANSDYRSYITASKRIMNPPTPTKVKTVQEKMRKTLGRNGARKSAQETYGNTIPLWETTKPKIGQQYYHHQNERAEDPVKHDQIQKAKCARDIILRKSTAPRGPSPKPRKIRKNRSTKSSPVSKRRASPKS